jgi:hypothetical protein
VRLYLSASTCPLLPLAPGPLPASSRLPRPRWRARWCGCTRPPPPPPSCRPSHRRTPARARISWGCARWPSGPWEGQGQGQGGARVRCHGLVRLAARASHSAGTINARPNPCPAPPPHPTPPCPPPHLVIVLDFHSVACLVFKHRGQLAVRLLHDRLRHHAGVQLQPSSVILISSKLADLAGGRGGSRCSSSPVASVCPVADALTWRGLERASRKHHGRGCGGLPSRRSRAAAGPRGQPRAPPRPALAAAAPPRPGPPLPPTSSSKPRSGRSAR